MIARIVCFFRGHQEGLTPFVVEAVKVAHRLDGSLERSRALLHIFYCKRCGGLVRESLQAATPRVVIEAQAVDDSAGT